MGKTKVFITGATGTMGSQSLKRMARDLDRLDITILSRDNARDRKMLDPYKGNSSVKIVWGDLTNYEDVSYCVKDADIILHIGAFVSPAADYHPEKAMEVNLGSTNNIIRAIYEHGKENSVRLVYIGTVAQTGDRMPPIHWGRVGDPIKPSMFDYYAVSKVAAERAVIESGIKYWVSLRQTGIMGPAMSKVKDAIMFHNCYDNVLEYVSDRDSGRLMANLCKYEADNKLQSEFWGHIYNIGGGESCRTSTIDMFRELYGAIGLTRLEHVLEPKWQATKNFHGQYYLDSDKLENYLHFRRDSMQYYYDSYLKQLGLIVPISRAICKIPGGQKLMGLIMKKMFSGLSLADHGTRNFIKNNRDDHIEAYWGGKEAWKKIPENLKDFEFYSDWGKVTRIDHGYDEEKPQSKLTIEDVRQAAVFRGGECLSDKMEKGNWHTKLVFKCAFGHTFEASPKAVLEGGALVPRM